MLAVVRVFQSLCMRIHMSLKMQHARTHYITISQNGCRYCQAHWIVNGFSVQCACSVRARAGWSPCSLIAGATEFYVNNVWCSVYSIHTISSHYQRMLMCANSRIGIGVYVNCLIRGAWSTAHMCAFMLGCAAIAWVNTCASAHEFTFTFSAFAHSESWLCTISMRDYMQVFACVHEVVAFIRIMCAFVYAPAIFAHGMLSPLYKTYMRINHAQTMASCGKRWHVGARDSHNFHFTHCAFHWPPHNSKTKTFTTLNVSQNNPIL